jgi:hypothetical protein
MTLMMRGGAVDVEASGRTALGAVAGEGGGGGGDISATDLALAVGELGGWEGVGERESLLEAKVAHGGGEGETGHTDRRVAACVGASVVASCFLTKELEAGESGRKLEAGQRGRTDRRLTKGLEKVVGGCDRGGGRYGRLSQFKSHSPGMPIYVHTCCIFACLNAYVSGFASVGHRHKCQCQTQAHT